MTINRCFARLMRSGQVSQDSGRRVVLVCYKLLGVSGLSTEALHCLAVEGGRQGPAKIGARVRVQ